MVSTDTFRELALSFPEGLVLTCKDIYATYEELKAIRSGGGMPLRHYLKRILDFFHCNLVNNFNGEDNI